MPETTLWREVIFQALEDIFSKEYKVQHDAILWFFRNSNDFNTVCDFAGIAPRHVRMLAFEKIMIGR